VSTRAKRSSARRPPARCARAERPPRGAPLAALLAHARRALAGVPPAAWVCALLAFTNAACWSLITPPFQALDEPDHFAYVQLLAESGRLPSSAKSEYSQEEQLALQDLNQRQVRFRPAGHPIFARAQRRQLERDLSQPLSRRGPGGAGVATSEPPLYYALQTIPYALASSGSILDRLELMRLLSALMGALTALFVFLFLREALPSARWAWTVGGLGAALGPLFGFSTSTVNPDALLFAISAAIFYCLARASRRGLTQPLALTIGVLSALGFLTKLNFAGLFPGVALALILLARREARAAGRAIYARRLAPTLAIALAPGALYALVNRLSHHRTLGLVSNGLQSSTSGSRSFTGELSYIWQLYLPRLPFMHNDFAEIFTTRQIWLRNIVGLYGWGDTTFPGWVYSFALLPAGAIALLCLRALVIHRAAVRERIAELLSYALIALGVLILVGAASYLLFPGGVAEFADARYLLPMLALWAAVLALAARGAGERWGPAVGVLLVVLVLAHDLFAQLQVLARYYG
jgi:4-amino-4-deoxy-L-arabinose transferase-like glycosyltransferase